MLVNLEYRKKIEEAFLHVRELAQYKEKTLFHVLETCTEDEAICLKYLYAFMPEQDLANYDGELFLKFVKQALSVRKKVAWGEKLVDGLFLNYILQYRMSNEAIVYYKKDLFEAIYPRIKGKSMMEAALCVNYWCLEKATYQTTNARTTDPLTTIRNAYGRCGEESVLAVAAFRSVGIPARQAYTPRWAHCDDNHAWVEVWIDGEWHFLGACEPEPTLDAGWFQLSASRGMLIQSKVFATTVDDTYITKQTERATDVNTLDRYAKTKEITVEVVDCKNKPLSGLKVSFQVVNYAELFPLVTLQTNDEGKVFFRTGYGDLIVNVYNEKSALLKKVDVRCEDRIQIQFDPKQAIENQVETFTLVPPKGRAPQEKTIDLKKQETHEKRIQEAQAKREAYIKTFYLADKAKQWASGFGGFKQGIKVHLESARGNYEEIQKFYEDDETKKWVNYKVKMLNTMEAKDLSDTSCDVLKAHLLHALQFKDEYEEEVFVKGILAPRIATEKITPYRQKLQDYFSPTQIKDFKKDANQIYTYINTYIREVTSEQNGYLCACPEGVMALRVGHKMSKKIVFVGLCRSFGIPAYIKRENGNICYYQQEKWTEIQVGEKQKEVVKNSVLVLTKKKHTVFEYRKNYTLAKYEKGVYHTLGLWDSNWIGEEIRYQLEPGTYRITTVNREASGTAHVRLYTIELKPEQTNKLEIELETINLMTAKQVIIQDTTVNDLRNNKQQLEALVGEGRKIVAYIAPEEEPTQHLLNEMIENEIQYRNKKPGIIFIVKKAKDLQHTLIQEIQQKLPFVEVYRASNSEEIDYLYKAFEIQDKTLPLAYVMNEPMKGIGAMAGYHVGIGKLLLDYIG